MQIFPAAALKLICSKESAPMLASIDSKPIHNKRHEVAACLMADSVEIAHQGS
jgi:hypothetical protein